ncbi:MAG: diaminohydroxyphosphoribosylaminopyrimidine deaminase [Pelagibacterales bacterium]|nr:diaminohydroxyphosphoribosylaminopyrimidine deaminase [Pelagibacterales bacterium]
MKINHNNFLNLAFNLAKINLGKTNLNPSVGCVVVKNDSVISSGFTSKNGRPHAEANALSSKKNFKDSEIYITMEPCTHYGLTPPCTNIIKKKGVRKVFYSFNDVDKRTAKKAQYVLKKKNINTHKKKSINFNDFYNSYFINKNYYLPFIDAKIALSKDYYSINKKKKWITNHHSRNRVHLIRSNYDSIISTSKSINKDNSLLNCRLNGFDNNKPDLIIIDLKLDIKTNLNLFNLPKQRKILIVTSSIQNKKMSYLKKRGVKFIKLKFLKNKNDFIHLFKTLKKKGHNRILVESGLKFLNKLLKYKLIFNLYLFKSFDKLGKEGLNNAPVNFIKRLKIFKKIKVNLNGDELYKAKII